MLVAFCITVPLWRESTSHQWSSLTKDGNVMCFCIVSNKLLDKQSGCWCFKTPWRSCDIHVMSSDEKLEVDSIQRCHLDSIGNPTVELRRSYDRLISTMEYWQDGIFILNQSPAVLEPWQVLLMSWSCLHSQSFLAQTRQQTIALCNPTPMKKGGNT